MSDSTLNRFVASGTTAERTAFVPSPPTPASGPDPGYTFFDTDDNTLYAWDGSAWVAAGGGSGNVSTVATLTADQVIVGAGSTDVDVLAAGTDGDVLTMVSGAPAWQAPSSGGGMVQLAQIVTAGSQTTVDFAGISGAYSALKIIYITQDTQSGTSFVFLRVRLNNDSTAGNYTDMSRAGSSNGVALTTPAAASSGGVPVGGNAQSGNTNIAGSGEITIVNYAGTTWTKRLMGLFALDDGSSNGTLFTFTGRWKSTAAVTRVTFTTDGTAFTDGSVFTLYGLQ